MIPKIIHYCWYGKGEKSATIEMCIASWRKYCPDYEIKEWNEDNSPMYIRWMRDAYRHQKYAFVADYARFDVFLDEKCFLGREDAYNANMAILGAEKGFDL